MSRTDPVEFRAHGGANFIGASCYELRFGNTRILVDYGGGHGTKELVGPAFDGPSPHHVLLTHGHFDHVGALLQAKLDKSVVLWATEETIALAGCCWRDTHSVAKKRGYLEPFRHAEVDSTLNRIQPMPVGRNIRLTEEVTVWAVPAGHILGAVSFVFGYQGGAYVVTGDVAYSDGVFTPGALPFSLPAHVPCRLLVRDSTCLKPGRQKQSRPSEQLVNATMRVLLSGGHVLIPALSIGRAQEAFGILWEAGIHHRFPVYLEGAYKTTDVYRRLASRGQLLRFVRRLRTDEEREAILRGNEPAVIIATSGMLYRGTPSAWWAQRLLPRKNSAIFFVNWLDPCSSGREVWEGRCDDVVQVSDDLGAVRGLLRKAEVGRIGVSAHMSYEEGMDMERRLLLDVNRLPAKGPTVIYVHGEDEAIEAHLIRCGKSDHSDGLRRVKSRVGETILV